MRVRTGDGGRLRWLGHAVIIASLLLATALGHDEFNCITLSKTTWHRPDNRGEVFVGQTSWVQFDVSLLDRDPVTGNNCRWMKKLEVVLEVDASGMGGTVVPYPVTSLEEVSVEQDVQDHASEGVSWDTFELWREGMGFSTKTMYRSLFFITGMPGARPGTHALQVKLKATVGDEAWIDREEYCRIGQRHTACTGRCASDATCLASCEDQRSRDEQECLLAISGITTEWKNVSQGMPHPLEFEIKLPYQVKLDPKSKNQYVGGSSKLSLTVTNTGVEALEEPRLVLEIADGDREYLRLEDEAIELGQSILPGQSVENVPAGIRISRDAWVQDTNSQPITYRIGTRLDFTSGLTRQEPGIPLEYTKDTTLVLQTRDVPRLVFTVLDPQTGQAMDLRKDAITLTPLANATLVIDIRNTQPGYAHDCLGKLSLSAGVLHIVNASHLLSAGNRTKLGEEHYFELGDFDIDVRKELRIEGMAKFTNEGEYEASFGVVNCRDATRRVHAVKAETIKLLVGPVPLAIDQGIIAQKQTYAEGALVEFYLGAVNPTQVPFERCVLTVTLTLNENGDCKWSLTDQAYDDMSGDCSGDGGPSISCATSGLSEGSEVVYIACRDDTDAVPNEDTIATNEHVDYTVDTTPPVITVTSVGGDASSPWSTSDSTPAIVLTTNENGDCRASVTDESYDDMSNDVDCTGDGGTGHTCQLGSLSDAASQAIHVACRDTQGNKHIATDNTNLAAEIDTAVPTQSGWDPAKGATVTTTAPTITLTLGEDGDCKWSLADQAYGDMSGDCTGDGGPSISCATSSLSEGSEVVYIACRDDTDVSPNEDTVATNEHVDYTVSVVQTCTTVCQGSGYSAGTCRQNAGKCTQNGETHVAAGDTYCTGGASADTCCCA